ncbi:hypothetical protein PG996_009868 [Apiospora saccharicola]|uniref:DUF7580 domain-containing protein n=1 Tax=Apiospora saccharicola TaxID=335842 RepID=A0ABR1ULZ2_9PEZI
MALGRGHGEKGQPVIPPPTESENTEPGAWDNKNSWSMLSLRDVLRNHGKTLPELRYGHKMKLAVLVARALLQLSASSWITEVLTSENIVLLRKDDATMYNSIYVSMPILPARPPALQLNLPTQITKDEQRLFSLGIILIELALGTCWEQIRASTGSTSDRDIAQDKLREVREVNEFCYLAAKYCINLEIVDNNRDLETRELRKDVCEKVVDRLEDNL